MPIDPSTVPGYFAHYKADTLTEADGTALATWPDASAAARDLTQGTAANQPVVRASSLNGLRTVEFTPTQFLTSATFAADSQPNTVFIVAKPDVLPSVLAKTLVAYDGVASTRRWAVYAEQATDEWRAYAGAALNSTHVITAGRWYRIAVVFEGTTSDVFVDDAAAVRGSAGTHSVTAVRVGAHYDGTLGWDGNIAEVLVYNTRVADADITAIQQYLRDKWFGTAVVVAGGGGPTVETVAASSEGVIVAGGGTPSSTGTKQALAAPTVAGGGGPAPTGIAASFTGVVVGAGGGPSVAAQKAGLTAATVAGGGTPVPVTGSAAVSGSTIVAGGGTTAPAAVKAGLAAVIVAGGGTPAPTASKQTSSMAVVAGGGDASAVLLVLGVQALYALEGGSTRTSFTDAAPVHGELVEAGVGRTPSIEA